MRALVVYDSVYGNTEKVARAVAEGIAPLGEAKVVRAAEADVSEVRSIDLLFIGSPVHAGRPTEAVRGFVNSIPADVLGRIGVATFDTRMKVGLAKIFGYAGERMAKSLKERGANLLAGPEGFIVEGKKGPLREGELERAAGWAKRVAEAQKPRTSTA